jgi:hypothetical protein
MSSNIKITGYARLLVHKSQARKGLIKLERPSSNGGRIISRRASRSTTGWTQGVAVFQAHTNGEFIR